MMPLAEAETWYGTTRDQHRVALRDLTSFTEEIRHRSNAAVPS
jgi:hypothetical protein